MTERREVYTRIPRPSEGVRTGLDIESLKCAFVDNLFYVQGKYPEIASLHDYYMAMAYTVRERILRRWICSTQSIFQVKSKVVCYLSAEFLIGPQLGSNMVNLGIFDDVHRAVSESGFDLDRIIDQEGDPGLGNGGLGRLAACYLDSLATLEIPAIGYGIRYEFGIFDQEIKDGWQVEVTDKWLAMGNPWEIPRPETSYRIGFGGRTESYHDEAGYYRVRWIPERMVKGMAYDSPILGYKVNTCNTLRLWKAEAIESFDFQAFNVGDYYGAVEEKNASENLTKVLYPNDESMQGKQLRLEQQYFFVSCSLRDIIRLHTGAGEALNTIHEKVAIQLNDTHPAIGVVEFMRLLVDEHLLPWDGAWEITRNTFAYTNHTLLPEALETWAVALFERLLPRHLEIVYEINRRFLDEVRLRYPGDTQRLERLSLFDSTATKRLRMANLACVGSHAVNGVAELHTELLKRNTLRDFYEMMPEKFSNKTNGVTPRRFMVLSNPGLTNLLKKTIGDSWIADLDQLRGLEAYAEDPGFLEDWRAVKLANKRALAGIIKERTAISVDPASMFDIQVKRLHEYKRQHLNVLHIITLYNRCRKDHSSDITPRTVVFGGKAAPGYFMAKLIIKLIHSVGEVVNSDPHVAGRLKVAFLPDFNVRRAQHIYPAADLSEQISTAGKEASGTGNMKFSMNGALTIGTLDGANIEIRQEVGPENFFLFGLTANQVAGLKAEGYRPRDYYEGEPELREAIDMIASGCFSHGDKALFRPLVDELLNPDEYMLLADYASYLRAQQNAGNVYQDEGRWARMSVLNVARMGKFSSDRAIREYCDDIWHAKPVPVALE